MWLLNLSLVEVDSFRVEFCHFETFQLFRETIFTQLLDYIHSVLVRYQGNMSLTVGAPQLASQEEDQMVKWGQTEQNGATRGQLGQNLFKDGDCLRNGDHPRDSSFP